MKNAKAMAATFIERGYKIVSGGTDNHLMLVDPLIGRELTGKDADAALGKANITVNKNSVPNDRFPVRDLRRAYRHPGHHRRGFREAESIQLANWICDVLDSHDNEEALATVREKVLDICRRFRSTHNQPDLQVEDQCHPGWHCFCSAWQDETEVTMCDDMEEDALEASRWQTVRAQYHFRASEQGLLAGMCAA